MALIESDRRKAAFLREATRDLPNVRIIRERAESVPEEFEWALSRAVNLNELAGVSNLARHLAFLGGEEPPAVPSVAWQPHSASHGARTGCSGWDTVVMFHVKHTAHRFT